MSTYKWIFPEKCNDFKLVIGYALTKNGMVP